MYILHNHIKHIWYTKTYKINNAKKQQQQQQQQQNFFDITNTTSRTTNGLESFEL